MNKKEALEQVREDLSCDNIPAQFFIDESMKIVSELDETRKQQIQNGQR